MDLNELQGLVAQLEIAEVRVAKCEAKLKEAKRLRDYYQNEVIPEAMGQAKITSLETPTGRISVKRDWAGQPHAADRQKAYQWLADNGYADLITSEVTASFPVKERGKAQELRDRLTQDGMTVTDKATVHPQRMAKFVREHGPSLPDFFNVRPVAQAKFKPTKKPIYDGEES